MRTIATETDYRDTLQEHSLHKYDSDYNQEKVIGDSETDTSVEKLFGK